MRPQIDQHTPEEAAAVRLPSPDSDSAKPIGEVVETPPAALVTSI
jgi:hypothetical protein